MQIDSQALRRHYASLSDEELLALDEAELTEVAQKCYDAEFVKRGLTLPQAEDSVSDPEAAAPHTAFDATVDPDWLSEAACAGSFSKPSGYVSDASADNAVAALEAAGIPCQIVENEVVPPPEDPKPYIEYAVMVPRALKFQATNVLDQAIFNSMHEAGWTTHLEALSDQELRALNPDIICGGLKDLIERVTRAYYAEVERRRQ